MGATLSTDTIVCCRETFPQAYTRACVPDTVATRGEESLPAETDKEEVLSVMSTLEMMDEMSELSVSELESGGEAEESYEDSQEELDLVDKNYAPEMRSFSFVDDEDEPLISSLKMEVRDSMDGPVGFITPLGSNRNVVFGGAPLSKTQAETVTSTLRNATIRRPTSGIVPAEVGNDTSKYDMLLQELIDTEEIYVSKLKTLIEEYITPIKAVISDSDSSIVFSGGAVPILLKLHEYYFLKELTSTKDPVKAFSKVSPYFKMYSSYISNFGMATKRLDVLVCENKDLKKILQNSTAEPIDSLMISPVQRIPRYLLLLQQLLESVPTDSEQYAGLRKVHSELETVATLLNTAMASRESLERMQELHQSIKHHFDNLIQPSRYIVKEGFAQKVFKNKIKDKVVVFLFNDMILWTTPKLRFKQAFMFEPGFFASSVGVPCSGVTSVLSGVQFMGPSGISEQLVFETEHEQKEWLRLIQEYSNKLNE